MLERKEEIKQVLRKLHKARPEKLQQLKKDLAKQFKGVDPKELALAEQELIQEGVGRDQMKRLCDVHLEVMKKELALHAKKIKLPSWHPIQISMDEHKIIKKNLKRLKRTENTLKKANSFDEAKKALGRLKELSHFFLETEKHHKREEEALFPRLEAHGVTEPPRIFKEDHVEFLAKKKMLYDTVMDTPSGDYKEFLEKVTSIIDFLARNLEEHIYKEDNILYPMALQTLEKNEWPQVRKKFDVIGYCCFAPADLRKKKR